MSLTSPDKLPGFSVHYQSEARLAFAIAEAMKEADIGGGSGSTGTQRTTTYSSTNTSGTVALGAKHVSIANNGSAAGIVGSNSLPKGAVATFPTTGSDTLNAITYNATGTEFLILEIR